MSEIISKRDIPSGMFEPAGIKLEDLDKVFNATKKYPGAAADLLLNSESTAIYHLDTENTFSLRAVYIRPVILGVNYHNGHSEGHHKIIVQNIPDSKGPWVLFRPPGSEERTFYLQDMVFPRIVPAKFDPELQAPGKNRERYFHRGDPLEIFSEFRELGFEFVDEPMTEEYTNKIGYRRL